MKPALFDYRAPRTLDEAIGFLAGDADAMVLAGGQSLMPAMNFRAASPSLLVDIQHIAALKGVTIADGEIRIKAMTRHRELELDAGVKRANPLIAETMQHVAHIPIRNRGTIVGSLCHADPSAELPLLFVLLDGMLVAQGPAGTRQVPAREFFKSFLTTARRQDEIVIEARLPVLPPGAGWAYDEVTRRHGDFALVGVGCVLQFDGEGRAADVRLAACGIADRPLRLTAAEKLLNGTRLAAIDLDDAVLASVGAVTVADDMNTTASFRRRVLGGLIRRLVARAASRPENPYR
ncbi:MAG TPA: xanthine dehydrogenase family protein subunit M [Xanthobacteraceae bacterium]|nr:xanthine dehydrogenase family protein subunit M [Xanthobacteraceae bacterium]